MARLLEGKLNCHHPYLSICLTLDLFNRYALLLRLILFSQISMSLLIPPKQLIKPCKYSQKTFMQDSDLPSSTNGSLPCSDTTMTSSLWHELVEENLWHTSSHPSYSQNSRCLLSSPSRHWSVRPAGTWPSTMSLHINMQLGNPSVLTPQSLWPSVMTLLTFTSSISFAKTLHSESSLMRPIPFLRIHTDHTLLEFSTFARYLHDSSLQLVLCPLPRSQPS